MALAAVVVGASAPADARLRARSTPASRGAQRDSIDAAERGTIAARLAYVGESGKSERRTVHVASLSGDSRAIELGEVDSYPVGSTTDGALLVLSVADAREGHTESIVRVDVRTGARHVLGHAGILRHPSVARDGAIAFESDAASFRDLYLVDGKADAKRRLTDNAEGNYEPSFFPDGRALAFTSSRDGDAEIYTMDRDGGAARRLTRSPGDDMSPRISPDGRRIAFISGRMGEDRIFVMGADGQGVRPVRLASPAESEREHAWSPDGRRLVFVARGRSDATDKSRIFVWNAERDEVTQLTDGSAVSDMPAFSPDGRYIAFVSDASGTPDLWLMRVDGSGAVPVFEASAPSTTGARRWLPTWIARAGDPAASTNAQTPIR